MKMDVYQLLVMDELKNDPYFYKTSNLLRYSVPNVNEKLDQKIIIGKSLATKDLAILGAIEIYNKGEERVFIDPLIYEFELIINHSAFEGIYKKLIWNKYHVLPDEYLQRTETEKSLPVLKINLNYLIKISKFGKKERLLLNYLKNFKPIDIELLKSKCGSKAFYNLKVEVNKKLEKTGFKVITVKGKHISDGNYYQMDFSTPK